MAADNNCVCPSLCQIQIDTLPHAICKSLPDCLLRHMLHFEVPEAADFPHTSQAFGMLDIPVAVAPEKWDTQTTEVKE